MISWLVLQPLWEVSQRAPWEAGSLRHLVTTLLHGIIDLARPGEAHGAMPTGTFVAFGPQNYVRQTGKPITVTSAISLLQPNTACTGERCHGDSAG